MHKIKKKLIYCVIVLGVMLLGACSMMPATPEPVELDSGVYFPQLQPMEEMPLALLYGELINQNGCLRVITDEGGEDYLVLWPAGMEVTVTNDMIVILDINGVVVARVGDQIRLVGGEYTQRDWVLELLQPGNSLPDDCPGPYWLTGEISQPDSP